MPGTRKMNPNSFRNNRDWEIKQENWVLLERKASGSSAINIHVGVDGVSYRQQKMTLILHATIEPCRLFCSAPGNAGVPLHIILFAQFAGNI